MTTATSTITASRKVEVTPARTSFIDTLASEWTKLMSLRSSHIAIVLAVGLSLGLTAILSAAIGGSWGSQQSMFPNFDPIAYSLDAMLFCSLALAVFGVSSTAAEYSNGMIRLTLAATPRRAAVLSAKVVVVGLVSLAVGLVAAFGVFFIAQTIYGTYGMPSSSIAGAGVPRAILAAAAMTVASPLLGVAAGVLLRSTAGAITLVLAMRFVPMLFGSLLPVWWQENLIAYLPSHASQAAILGHLDSADPTWLEPSTALFVVCAWLVASLGAAYIVFRRRDA